MRDETELKNKIAAVMGHNFADALYEGTTSETLTINFLSGISAIAYICERDGWIDISTARNIMEAANPGKMYKGEVFEGYAKAGLRKAIREAEQRQADYYTKEADKLEKGLK